LGIGGRVETMPLSGDEVNATRKNDKRRESSRRLSLKPDVGR
jgi:hypothetical protein